MISGWFLDDFWMICGWYLDDMCELYIWMICGWYHPDFTHISPKYHTHHPHIIQISSKYHPVDIFYNDLMKSRVLTQIWHNYCRKNSILKFDYKSTSHHPDITQISSRNHPEIIHKSFINHSKIIQKSSRYHPVDIDFNNPPPLTQWKVEF